MNSKKSNFLTMLLVISAVAISCNASKINKSFVHSTAGYSKAVMVQTGNLVIIYIAGLTGDGTNMEAQTHSTFANIASELQTCGATWRDIVKMNTYIVHCQPEKVSVFRQIRKEVMGEINMPASTVVGVEALAAPDKLIEIEAVAVVTAKNIDKTKK